MLKYLAQAVLRNHCILVSVITRAELSLATREADPATQQLPEAFAARLDAIQPCDLAAVGATTDIKVALRLAGTPRSERHGDCRACHCCRGDPSDQ